MVNYKEDDMPYLIQRRFNQMTRGCLFAVATLISLHSTSYAFEAYTKHISTLVTSTQKELKNIKSNFSQSKKQEVCSGLISLRKSLEIELFNKSCPTDSEIAFSFCQQRTEALTPIEARRLQNLLTEIDSLNESHCLKSASL